ncbi:unnamed protein product [Lactuca virosa]|uniref:DUF4283 domain-containing protein n=1 Tax=Lactuca virosa TaxID=75947 RepID=A0AAU9NBN3_9ASTR|nr:unnamed protein product [Lactuca virosa]
MARNLSKLGKRFAFVRFIKVSDYKRLERRLHEIWMGSFHLFASIARFNRVVSKFGEVKSQGKAKKLNSQGNGKPHKSFEHMANSQSHVNVQRGSYANVVKGDSGVKEEKKIVPGVCSLQGKEIDNPLSRQSSIFGKLRDIRLIPKLGILLKEEGFLENIIKYVASEWVFISFLSEDTCTRFKKCEGVKSYFSEFRPVVNGFYVKERAIWLELLGLPCCAWNDAAVKKIANFWGDICFLEEDENAPLAAKRVCIKTVISSLIHDKIRVVAQGIEYVVTVREISNWEPDLMEDGDIESDIPDLSVDEEVDVCFDEDEIEGFKDNDGDKVEEGYEDSVSMTNIHSKGDRGAGFVDRKVPRDVSSSRLVENVAPNAPKTAVDEVEGEKVSESISPPPGFQRKKPSSSLGSIKMLKKKVPVVVDDIDDVLKQYIEMGGLLGIRSWNAETKAASQTSNSQLLGRLADIDKSIDNGLSSEDIIRERRSILGDLANLEKVISLDVAQKVRSTWAVEGYGGGIWNAIVGSINQLHERGSIPLNSLHRVVGDGVHTRFWKDAWCSDIPFMMRFGRLFALATNQDAMVSEVWSSDGWNFHWRRGIRGGVVSAQLDRLVEILSPIWLEVLPDKWIWDLDPSVQVWSRVAHWLDLDIQDFSSISALLDWMDVRPIARMERLTLSHLTPPPSRVPHTLKVQHSRPLSHPANVPYAPIMQRHISDVPYALVDCSFSSVFVLVDRLFFVRRMLMLQQPYITSIPAGMHLNRCRAYAFSAINQRSTLVP